MPAAITTMQPHEAAPYDIYLGSYRARARFNELLPRWCVVVEIASLGL